jgi:hypothetical protein
MPLDPGFEAELRDSPEFKAAMRDAATEAQTMAITFARQVSRAPWMLRQGQTWEQAIQVLTEDDGRTVLLSNQDSAGHLVEWGSKNNPPWAILRRGVRAVGMSLSETPKP